MPLYRSMPPDTGDDVEGEAVVLAELCDQGYTVIACVKDDNSRHAVHLRQSIPAESLLVRGMDIESEKSINKFIREVGKNVKGNGVVWALVILNTNSQMRDVDDGAVDKQIDPLIRKHVIGVGHLIKRCLPLLRTSRGRIIAVTSAADREGHGKNFEDAIRSSSLHTLVQVVRRELKSFAVAGVNIEFGCPLAEVSPAEHNITLLQHPSSVMIASQQRGQWETDNHISGEVKEGTFKTIALTVAQSVSARVPELTYRLDMAS